MRRARRHAGDRLRRALPLTVLAVAAVGVAIIVTPPRRSGPALDPSSTDSLGTRALVDVLRELGRDVRVVDPSAADRAETTLLLVDNLTVAERSALRQRVSGGATAVVADPRSPLAPRVAGETGLLEGPLDRGCDLAALGDVERVRVLQSPVFEVPDGGTGCFPAQAGSWMTVQAVGAGHLIALGEADFLTNSRLADADHALLAVSLLAPTSEASVAIVRPHVRAPAGSASSLLGLIPTRVRAFVAQLLIAFLAVVAWRARRLGPALVERLPVRLAGADLVDAVGDLLRRHGALSTAARLVRDRVRLRLASALALAPDASAEQIATRAADLPGVEREAVESVLTDLDPDGDEQLVLLAQRAHEVEHAVLATQTTSNEESRVH